MSVTEKLLRGTTLDTVLSTGASLANGAAALSSAYTPTNAGYEFADWVLNLTFTTMPTAGTAVFVWLLREDGSANYETASTTGPILPARNFDLAFPVIAITTAQEIIRQSALPPGPLKAFVYNAGTGQTINSGYTLSCLPYTRQGV